MPHTYRSPRPSGAAQLGEKPTFGCHIRIRPGCATPDLPTAVSCLPGRGCPLSS